MKLLSDTSQNGKVVELTEQEWREFKILAFAVEGKTEEDVWQFKGLPRMHEEYATSSGIQFQGVFGAIRAFYESKFNITKFQILLDGMKNAVQTQEEE